MSGFCLGVSSSIDGAKVGPVVCEEGVEGHVLYSYRDLPMGVELGDGCVAFADPLEHEELYFHMDWIRAAPYREASAQQLAAREGEGRGRKGREGEKGTEGTEEATGQLGNWATGQPASAP
jgi:hypothetical protein